MGPGGVVSPNPILPACRAGICIITRRPIEHHPYAAGLCACQCHQLEPGAEM